jgi:hypothetical protein
MAASHQIERFKFKNIEGIAVNDLTVEFDMPDVKTRDPGPFDKAVTEGKRTKLDTGDVKNDETAKITFERNGEFNILHWQWTLDGNPVGDKKNGPPAG